MGRTANQEALRWVEGMLARQVSHHDIVALGAPEWKVHSRTVYRWIAQVYERMEVQAEREKPMRRQQMVSSLRLIMQKAIKVNKLHDAIDCLDRMARLYGLYQDKVAVTGTIGLGVTGLSTLGFKSTADVQGRIDELRARMADGGSIAAGYLEASCTEAPTNGSGGNGAAKGNGSGN